MRSATKNRTRKRSTNQIAHEKQSKLDESEKSAKTSRVVGNSRTVMTGAPANKKKKYGSASEKEINWLPKRRSQNAAAKNEKRKSTAAKNPYPNSNLRRKHRPKSTKFHFAAQSKINMKPKPKPKSMPLTARHASEQLDQNISTHDILIRVVHKDEIAYSKSLCSIATMGKTTFKARVHRLLYAKLWTNKNPTKHLFNGQVKAFTRKLE